MEGPGQEESGGQAATAPGPRRPPPAHVTRRAALPVSVGRAGQAGRPALGGLLRALPSTPCASFPAFGVFTSGVSQLSLGSNPGSATHILPVALGPGEVSSPVKWGDRNAPGPSAQSARRARAVRAEDPAPGAAAERGRVGPGQRGARGVPGTRSPAPAPPAAPPFLW